MIYIIATMVKLIDSGEEAILCSFDLSKFS